MSMTEHQGIDNFLAEKIKEAIDEIRKKERVIYEHSKKDAMQSLLTNMAHHWRQPLAACSMYLQNLEYELDNAGCNTDMLAQQINKALFQIEMLSGSITKFTRFYELQSDTVVGIKEGFGLFKGLSFEFLREDGVSLEMEVDEGFDCLASSGDWVELFTIFVKNSYESMKSHKKESIQIKIEAKAGESYGVITISDNGGGIDQSMLPDRLFEPYTTTYFKSREKGLGLYNARNIITYSLKGEISATNLQNGATFIIKIPKS